jgi:hypothetical protein
MMQGWNQASLQATFPVRAKGGQGWQEIPDEKLKGSAACWEGCQEIISLRSRLQSRKVHDWEGQNSKPQPKVWNLLPRRGSMLHFAALGMWSWGLTPLWQPAIFCQDHDHGNDDYYSAWQISGVCVCVCVPGEQRLKREKSMEIWKHKVKNVQY